MKRMNGWGVTGWSNEWTALGNDDPADDEVTQLNGYGIKRTVDPGVVYTPAPSSPGVPEWHARRVGKGRVFEMEWREHVEPPSRSLFDIQASLASRRKSLATDDPDLAMLDAAVDGLLAAAVALHARGFSLGFLSLIPVVAARFATESRLWFFPMSASPGTSSRD